MATPADKLKGRVAQRKRSPRALHGRPKPASKIPRLEPEMAERVKALKAEGKTVKVFYSDPNLLVNESDQYEAWDGTIVEPDLADELIAGIEEGEFEPTDLGPDAPDFHDPDEIDDSEVIGE
jgi:hypothetical protein